MPPQVWASVIVIMVSDIHEVVDKMVPSFPPRCGGDDLLERINIFSFVQVLASSPTRLVD